MDLAVVLYTILAALGGLALVAEKAMILGAHNAVGGIEYLRKHLPAAEVQVIAANYPPTCSEHFDAVFARSIGVLR